MTTASPTPVGDSRKHRSGRRGLAGLALVSLVAGVFAASLPATAADETSTASSAEAGVTPVRIEAETYTGSNNGDVINGRVMNTGVEPDGGASGGSRVKNTYDGAEIWFDDVDLGTTPLSSLTVRYVVNESRSGVSPSIDVYLDEKSAENKVATVALEATGSDWSSYGQTTADLLTEVSGEHKVIVVMHVDPKPGESGSYPNYVGNIDFLEFGPESLPETFLTTADAWKYSDDGTDPSGDGSLSWTTADFDDAAWKEAVGPFGSKRGAADLGGGFVANTLLQYTLAGSPNTVPTYHFRNEFEISAAQLAQVESLQGKVTYDDAARVYVNGEKVAGFVDDRVDEAANQNLTYAGASNGNPLTSTFTIPVDALKAGGNTIAVALYQDRETSSDIYFDLTSLAPTGPAPAPEIADIALHVGATQAERNLTWYSNVDVPQVAQLAEAADVVDGVFPASARTVEVTRSGGTTSGEFFRDATFDRLEENTEYAYRVGSEATGWSDVHTFRTQDFSGDFSFLFFGDPQVGASGNLARDEAGWIDTLNVATQTYPDAEMLFSAGDQVEAASSEAQYDTFLKPEQVRSVPLAVTNGNHDVGSKAYEQHFNVPNEDLESGGASNGTSSGGDYWFLYKDVLFLNINSNSRDFDSHNAFMEKVIAEQGDKARWKVLAFHHSIYSVASHTNDGDIIDRRNNMPAKISELGFDMVLMGHDHNYTRSYLIKDGQLADPTEVAGQERVEAEDGEALYVTANSSSGSKYYDTRAPEAWFASVINQEKVRNYSAIEVTDKTLTVRTLRSQANGVIAPVNSVVDEVVLAKADATTELDVSVDVSTRTLGGTQHVSTVVTNNEDAPVDVVVETAYGAKSFAAVQPGKSASVAMSSRATAIPAGDVTVTVTGRVGGETVTTSKTASYPAAG
ncbi:fibronectin type III domain-containing protein [Promicromonospora iranensis]|uniref:fibronectin type III domain-containing protein n=1 Tax=Promicromonospora iranensis TaxID=1105144 RepID=UPI0023A9C0B3|nr:fibronectin type III domain-containing protein [Promicromonospora iranensis]